MSHKPRRIFVNSMSDLFHEDVSDEFILQVFDVMRQCENGYSRLTGRGATQHTFQILTKRPMRMLDFCTRLRFAQNDERGLYLAKELPHNGFKPMKFLPHIWLGVSCEDQATADERIPLLLQTPAAVRWVSLEPMLGPISFEGFFANPRDVRDGTNVLEELDWIIVGGESGPRARPMHPNWVRSIRDQCRAAGVPFFFKQWGEWITGQRDGDSFLWPDGIRKTTRFGIGNDHGFWDNPPTLPCIRVGKKAAGRVLDGRTWDEYPA